MVSIGSCKHFMLKEVLEGSAGPSQVERPLDILPTHLLYRQKESLHLCPAVCHTLLSQATAPSGQWIQRRKKHNALGTRTAPPPRPSTKVVSKCWYFYPKRCCKEIQCGQQPFLSFDAHLTVTGFLNFSLAVSSCFFCLPFLWFSCISIKTLQAFIFEEISGFALSAKHHCVYIPASVHLWSAGENTEGSWRSFSSTAPSRLQRKHGCPSRDLCHGNIWFLVSEVLFVFDHDISSFSDAYVM